MKKVTVISLLFMAIAFQNYSQEFKSFAEYKEQQKAERKAKREAEAASFGNNIFRLIPLRMMDVDGVGFGLDYERIIDKNRNVGIVLPITYFVGNGYYDYYYNDLSDKFNYFYFSPGVKFYPFGQRKVNYAFGPNLLASYGSGTVVKSNYNNLTGTYTTYNEKATNFKMGMMVNNYLNVQFTQNLNFGVEAGFGVSYFDRWRYENNTNFNNGMNVVGHFAISFGYRF